MTERQSDVTRGPLAVVTGASTGIGRALAFEFAKHGYRLVLAADEPGIRDVAADLAATGAIPVEVDLATPEGVENLYMHVLTLGVPDVAVLNVGVGVGGRFDRTSLEDNLRLVDVNVRSTVHLAKLVVTDMVAAGSGRILVTSSIAAVAPGPYHSAYAASKAFVHSLAEGIREELKDTGVTVTSLMPGPTDTDFFARAGMQDTKVAQGEKDDPAEVARDAYEALKAGRSSVVAGSFKNRVQANIAEHLPDALAAPILARMAAPQGERDQPV